MEDIPAEYQIEPQQLPFAGNAYFNFINSLKSPNTKTTYIQCLKQYMQYRKVKAVDELLIGDQRYNDALSISSFIIFSNLIAVTYSPNILLIHEKTVSAIHLLP